MLAYSPNRGKGYAVRLGLAAARGEARIFTDVDLSYLEGIERIADRLWAGADVVIASRAHPESDAVLRLRDIGYLHFRQVQSAVFSRIARTVLGISHRDTQAGLKGLSARAAKTLLPLLECDDFAFDCELLWLCRRLGIPVAEAPIRFHATGGPSTTGLFAAARMVRSLIRIRRRGGPMARPPWLDGSREPRAA